MVGKNFYPFWRKKKKMSKSYNILKNITQALFLFFLFFFWPGIFLLDYIGRYNDVKFFSFDDFWLLLRFTYKFSLLERLAEVKL